MPTHSIHFSLTQTPNRGHTHTDLCVVTRNQGTFNQLTSLKPADRPSSKRLLLWGDSQVKTGSITFGPLTSISHTFRGEVRVDYAGRPIIDRENLEGVD